MLALTSGLGEQLWLGVVSGVVLTVFTTGLVVLFGVMRVVNMAHGAMYMLGAMTIAGLQARLGINYGISLILVIVAIGSLGVLINRAIVGPIERRLKYEPSQTAAVVLLETIALSFIIYSGIVLVAGSFPRAVDLGITGVFHVGGAAVTVESLVLCGAGVVAIAGLYLFFGRTPLGRSMRAAADSRQGAALTGINIRRMYDTAWFLSCALAALAGALVAPLSAADPGMGQDILIRGFAVIVVAGLSSIVGVAALAMGLSLAGAVFGALVSSYYQDAFIFGVMVIALLIKPSGIFAGGDSRDLLQT